MKECSTKHTIIIIFCSTVYKDKNWIQIRKYFEKKGMEVRIFTSIYEDGEDQLRNLIDELKQEAKEQEDKQGGGIEEPEPEIDRCDDILKRLTRMHVAARGGSLPEEEEPEKETKPKKIKVSSPRIHDSV